MKNRYRDRLLILFLVIACLLQAVPVWAVVGTGPVYDYRSVSGWPEAPEVQAESVYMIEVNSGAVLYDKSGEVQSFPASTTKIMTALLTLENCSMDEEVTFSHKAVTDLEQGGYHWEFKEGEVLTVNECLQFLMVESVNEVAYALAEHIAGSVEKFAEMMNARAAELGATATHFNNPHGLNDDNHYTTAHDMAMILWGCVQNERFRQYASLPDVVLAGRAIQTEGFSRYTNHHLMLLPESEYYDEDVVCGKTGYTSIAGNTLVTYASRGNMDVVCILMKGNSDRFVDTRALLDYAFDNFTLTSMAEAESQIAGTTGNGIPILPTSAEEGYLLLPNGVDWSQVTSEFAVTASAGSGDNLGERNWFYQGMPIGTARVTLSPAQASQIESEEKAENVPETENREDKRETAAESKASKSDWDLGGWNLPEIIALLVLAVLLVVLLAILIRLIILRAQRKRRRRRRGRHRRR